MSETRAFPAATVHLRAQAESVNGKTFLHGRAVPYNDPADIGWYLEEHAPGSLGASIRESVNGLPLLLFHDDKSFPIGRADKWDDNQKGLDGVWRLDTGDTAQRAAQLASDGMLAYLSIRFAPIRSKWTMAQAFDPAMNCKDHVLRQESRLLEVSLVSTPAFAGAAVTAVQESRL